MSPDVETIENARLPDEFSDGPLSFESPLVRDAIERDNEERAVGDKEREQLFEPSVSDVANPFIKFVDNTKVIDGVCGDAAPTFDIVASPAGPYSFGDDVTYTVVGTLGKNPKIIWFLNGNVQGTGLGTNDPEYSVNLSGGNFYDIVDVSGTLHGFARISAAVSNCAGMRAKDLDVEATSP